MPIIESQRGTLSQNQQSGLLTLKLQGGPMDAEEVAAFRRLPNLDDIVRVRVWDDEAKVAGRTTPPFVHYQPLLQRLVDVHRQARPGA